MCVVRNFTSQLTEAGVSQSSIDCFVDEAIECGDFASDWRNRRLAHRDLDLALSPSAKPLAPVSRQAIEVSLDALRTLLNEIESAYVGSTTAYADSFTTGDAESMLHVLRAGQIRIQDQYRRWDQREGK